MGPEPDGLKQCLVIPCCKHTTPSDVGQIDFPFGPIVVPEPNSEVVACLHFNGSRNHRHALSDAIVAFTLVGQHFVALI